MNTPRKPTVLVIDDDPNFHDLVRHILTEQAYQVWCITDPSELDDAECTTAPSAIILDWHLSDGDGTKFIQPIRRQFPMSPILFATCFSSPEIAATSIKLGAFDFLTKPLDRSRLLIAIANAAEQHRLLVRLHRFEEVTGNGFEGMIGTSPQMQTVYSVIRNVAPTDVNVMISGESGTGKELAASAIHQQSNRSSGPFIALNMASISHELAEATLFGHEKGSFTGADKRRAGAVREAAGGTLFLDEITEMPISLQSKLLRFLQENTFRPVGADQELQADTRIISATNRDPLIAVREKRLREDLYYRLNVVPVRMPPLRERSCDIPLLVQKSVANLSKKHGKQFIEVHQEALEILTQFSWPGNVRELLHTLERIIVLNHGEVIEPHMLPAEILQQKSPQGDSINKKEYPENHSVCSPEFLEAPPGTVNSTFSDKGFGGVDLLLEPPAFASQQTLAGCTLEELEKQAICDTLEAAAGNKAETARRLGISEKSIYNKMKRLGIGS